MLLLGALARALARIMASTYSKVPGVCPVRSLKLLATSTAHEPVESTMAPIGGVTIAAAWTNAAAARGATGVALESGETVARLFAKALLTTAFLENGRAVVVDVRDLTATVFW